MQALVTLGTLAVFLYVEIKAGSFGNNVFDQIKNQLMSGISSITDGITDEIKVSIWYLQYLRLKSLDYV